MKENPRPKTRALAPGSKDDVLSKVYFYDPLLSLHYKKVKSKSGRIYKRYQGWQRPYTGARGNKKYDWYIQVRIFNKAGKLVVDQVLSLGPALFPHEINTPKLFKGLIAEALQSDVINRYGGYHPGKGFSLAKIGKIVIVRRFRHKDGYEPYKGRK